MINIIDHLWQFSLPGIVILPTVIKLPHNTPKAYFYSQKQSKVLRKKDQTPTSSLSHLISTDKTSTNYLLILNSSHQLQFSLILENQLEELLETDQQNLAIIRLQEEQGSLILDCCFDAHGIVAVRPLLLYDKGRSLWSCQVDHLSVHSGPLKQYMINLWKELTKALPAKSKCRKIEVILGITASIDNINLLWCNKLIFDQKEFYSIDYSYHIKQNQQAENEVKHSRVQQSSEITQIAHQFEVKKKEPTVEEAPNGKDTSKQLLICSGCGAQTEEQMCKQAQRNDVVSLRRRNKLSIMGITQEFLPICQQCYFSIDE